MNSHVVLKLGVAYKANLKHIVQVIIFSVVFSGIITMTNSASLPTLNEHAFNKNKNNSIDLFPIVPGERPVPELYLFLHANNNMWLEILPDLHTLTLFFLFFHAFCFFRYKLQQVIFCIIMIYDIVPKLTCQNFLIIQQITTIVKQNFNL